MGKINRRYFNAFEDILVLLLFIHCNCNLLATEHMILSERKTLLLYIIQTVQDPCLRGNLF